MTSLKALLYLSGLLGGAASSLTGSVVASIPNLSNETPIGLTFGLILGGLCFTAVSAWNIAVAWTKVNNRLSALEKRLSDLESAK